MMMYNWMLALTSVCSEGAYYNYKKHQSKCRLSWPEVSWLINKNVLVLNNCSKNHIAIHVWLSMMVNLPHKVRGGKYFYQQYSLASTVPAVVCVMLLFNQVWSEVLSAVLLPQASLWSCTCMFYYTGSIRQWLLLSVKWSVMYICYAFFTGWRSMIEVAWFVKGAFRNLLRPLLWSCMFMV